MHIQHEHYGIMQATHLYAHDCSGVSMSIFGRVKP